MKKSLAVVLLGSALLLVGCSAQNTSSSSSSQETTSQVESPSYQNGVANTSRMRIEITDHKVVNPGEKGNEEGDSPVMFFWYKATNKSKEDIGLNLMWGLLFSGYQTGNDKLMGQGYEGIAFSDYTKSVKPGQTVESVSGFKLTDKTTPLKLVAQDSFTNQKLGEQEFAVE